MSIEDQMRPIYRDSAQKLSSLVQQAIAAGAHVRIITQKDCAASGLTDGMPDGMMEARARGTRRGAAAQAGTRPKSQWDKR